MKHFLNIFLVVLFFILFIYFIFNVKIWFVVSLILLAVSLLIDLSIISGLLFAIVFFGLFLYFKLYAEIWFWATAVVLGLIMQFELLQHLVFRFIAMVFGAAYLPLNMALMDVANWVKGFRKGDPVIYWMARIVIFPLLLFITVFSIPYEWILDRAH